MLTLQRSAPTRKEKFCAYWQGTGWRGNLALMAPFLLFYYCLLGAHQVWRDEINAWAIACVSTSVSDLLARVHFEAHPALWYLLLFAASKISTALWMLKAVQGLIGTAIYLLLALLPPFRRWELALLYGGSYIAFQYTVMSRMYGLEVLFLLLYLWSRLKYPERRKSNTLWLALMANIDLSAMILSTGLLLEYLLESRDEPPLRLREQFHNAAGALAIYGAGLAVSLATMWPAREIAWSTTGRLGSSLYDPQHLGEAMGLWLGVPWYPQAVSQFAHWPDLMPAGFFAPLVLLLYIPIFRGRAAMARFYFSVVLMGVVFSHLTNVAALRHTGVAYLAFVSVLWMMRSRKEPINACAYLLLGSVVVSSLFILPEQWRRPFTDAAATAQWIEEHRLGSLPILGAPDITIVSVTERLQRPAFQLECNCIDPVMTFHRRRDEYVKFLQREQNDALTDRRVAERIERGLNTSHTDQALLLLNAPLPEAQRRLLNAGGVKTQALKAFEEGYLPDEHFYLYQISAVSNTAEPPAAETAYAQGGKGVTAPQKP